MVSTAEESRLPLGLPTWLLSLRRVPIVAVHLLLFGFAYTLAFALRFDFAIPDGHIDRFLAALPILLAIRGLSFAAFRLYEGLWRYVSMRDLVALAKATTVSEAAFMATSLVLLGHGFPRSVFVLDWLLCLALVGGLRATIRLVRERDPRDQRHRRALVVGAGDAGEMLLREIARSNALDYEVVGLVDDDPRKQGVRIHGVGVVGTTADLPELCRRYDVDKVLVAIPSASAQEHRRIADRCRAAGVSYRTVPNLLDLVSGRARIAELRQVQPEELLAREAVHLDIELLRDTHAGRRVLVTGAAGSIGSELCRQVAEFAPERLIAIDRAESALYFTELELRRRWPSLGVTSLVGDVGHEANVRALLAEHTPHVVYHAAAYKHVPLMEAQPLDAIENNVFATQRLACACADAGVERFVLVSTDKAVHPVGVMGMSKRLAECALLSLAGNGTAFMSVRFGNVLGSDGSIVPLFRRQIADGGPVTVTDPKAMRYFMLISEAAQLVMQAGAMGRGGEVFFLDMGEPVNVHDLAHNMIRLSGLEPGRDVAIQVTGLRPGERLSEELVMGAEELLPSDHEKIRIVRNGHFDAASFCLEMSALSEVVARRDPDAAVERLRDMTSRY